MDTVTKSRTWRIMVFLVVTVMLPHEAAASADKFEFDLPKILFPAAPHNRGPRQPKVLVLHYSVLPLEQMFDHYVNGHVSAHYTVDRDGTLFQHVDESEAAHHAGVSFWRRSSVNQASVGVEIVNAGHADACSEDGQQSGGLVCNGGLLWEPFQEAQIASVVALCKDIVRRHNIDPFDVVGHSDIAPGRKEDPGPLFFWMALAKAGVGVAYDASSQHLVHGDLVFPVSDCPDVSVLGIQQMLANLGYKLAPSGILDEDTRVVVRAFNAHYLGQYRDDLSWETRRVLNALWSWQALR